MLIDTKQLFKCETCRHHQHYGCNTFCDAGEAYSPNINKLTAVDAVPVVRCEKCIGRTTWIRSANDAANICGMSGMFPRGETDFCSYGERKDDV